MLLRQRGEVRIQFGKLTHLSGAVLSGKASFSFFFAGIPLGPGWEINVASPAFRHTDVQALEFPAQTSFRSLAELTASLRKAPAFSEEADGRGVSAATGLKGAKAAMVAVGLEVAAAICVYGIWQVWHILR